MDNITNSRFRIGETVWYVKGEYRKRIRIAGISKDMFLAEKVYLHTSRGLCYAEDCCHPLETYSVRRKEKTSKLSTNH